MSGPKPISFKILTDISIRIVPNLSGSERNEDIRLHKSEERNQDACHVDSKNELWTFCLDNNLVETIGLWRKHRMCA
jgi:hypothetical protein